MEASVLKRRNNGVDLPKDFPECLERFREVSGLSWGGVGGVPGGGQRTGEWLEARRFAQGPGPPQAVSRGPAGARRYGGAVPQHRGRAGRRGVTLGAAAANTPAGVLRISPGLSRPAGAVQGRDRADLECPGPPPRREPLPAEAVEERDRPRLHKPLHPPDPRRTAGTQGDFDVSGQGHAGTMVFSNHNHV